VRLDQDHRHHTDVTGLKRYLKSAVVWTLAVSAFALAARENSFCSPGGVGPLDSLVAGQVESVPHEEEAFRGTAVSNNNKSELEVS